MKINEKKITRTIHFIKVTATIYNKENKEITTDDFSMPYHGENIEELTKRFMTNNQRLVDYEIVEEYDALYSITESVFIMHGHIEKLVHTEHEKIR